MKRIFTLLLALALFAGSAVFAESNSDALKILNVNLGSEPVYLDPGLNESDDSGHIINNTFEGLMREADGIVTPAAAEGYTVSDDKKVYTFKIRRDSKWSDGKPVSAFDFEYAWKRASDPYGNSPNAWLFEEANVESFRAVDAMTFEVKLSKPTPHFLEMTSLYPFFPVREDAVETSPDGAWAYDPQRAVSNGPFKLSQIDESYTILVQKNENYWNSESVMLDGIMFWMIVDSQTSVNAFNQGRFDVVEAVSLDMLASRPAFDPEMKLGSIDGLYYYGFNLDVKPLDNVLVRRALTLAIDRTAISDLTGGINVPATNMVSQVSRDDSGNIFSDAAGDYGIPIDGSGAELARALLSEAGYPNGEGFPVLEIYFNNSFGHKVIAEAVQKMWKENLNIDVVLLSDDWVDFQDKRDRGAFQIARAGWIGDYSDPMTFLSLFKSGSSQNFAGWSSKTYDALLEYSDSKEGAERYGFLYKALDMLMEDAAYMPIYHYNELYLVSDSVTGWEKNSRGLWFFGKADVSETQEEVLRPPARIEIDNVTDTAFNVRWENTGADYYMVLISTDEGEWSPVIKADGSHKWYWRPETCLSMAGFESGSVVDIMVVSVIGDRISDYSHVERVELQ